MNLSLIAPATLLIESTTAETLLLIPLTTPSSILDPQSQAREAISEKTPPIALGNPLIALTAPSLIALNLLGIL